MASSVYHAWQEHIFKKIENKNPESTELQSTVISL